jgi:hypothetical protein
LTASSTGQGHRDKEISILLFAGFMSLSLENSKTISKITRGTGGSYLLGLGGSLLDQPRQKVSETPHLNQ